MRALLLVVATAAAGLVVACPALAWSWPVDGPVLRPFVFGGDPYGAGQHRGIDVGAESGAAVAAPAGGVVSFAGTIPGGGSAVTIRTADGYSVTLVHLGSIGVMRGAVVDEGAAVGTVGPSGDAEWPEPYVHLGVRVTAEPEGYVDPLGLLPRRTAPASAPAHETGDAPATGAGSGDPSVPAGTGADAETAGSGNPAVETEADAAADGAAESDAGGGTSASDAEGGEDARGDTSESTSDGRDAAGATDGAAESGAAAETGAPAGEEGAETSSPPVGEAPSSEAPAESAEAGASAGSPVSEAPGVPAASPAAEQPDAAERAAPSDDPPVVDEDGPSALDAPAAGATPAADAPSTPTEKLTVAPDAEPVAGDPVSEPASPSSAEERAPEPAQIAEAQGHFAPVALERDFALELRGYFLPASAALPGLPRPVVLAIRPASGRSGSLTTSPPAEVGSSVAGGEAVTGAAARVPASYAATRANGAARARTVRPGPTAHDPEVRGGRPLARPPIGDEGGLPERPPWLLAFALLAAAGVLAALARRVRRARPAPAPEMGDDARIISSVGDPVAAEDPGCRGLAVRERPEAHRARGGIRRPVRHLRPVPPAEGQRRADGERDRREWDADHGHRGQGRRLAA